MTKEEKSAAYKKQWYEANREKVKKYHNEWRKEKAKKDLLYRFRCRVRDSVKRSFTRGNNQYHRDATTQNILGCTILEFKNYIESKFEKGMSLENHGEWHLDHIIPISSAETKEDIIRLNHYTNFQPLWAVENIKKGNKIIEKQLKLI